MKRSIHRSSLSLLSVLLFLGVSGQQQPGIFCSTHDQARIDAIADGDPVKLAQMAQDEQDLEAVTADFVTDNYGRQGGSTYVIPVVFHVIHENGPENISDAQIHDAMRILNDDFNQLNPDWDDVNPAFIGLVGNIGIEFRLAQKDPNGNCTKGITRTESPLTNDGTQTMKDLIQWPRNQYMNVWVAISANGAAGYTYTPGSVSQSWAASLDGIVLQHTYTGSIGTGQLSRSRTLTHEVGHWLNLRHTWGGTNSPGLASNCNTDDNVTDTPLTMGWTTCNLNGQSCGSLDNVENYMEYSYCSKMFTEGQKQRMLAALTSSTAQRNQLWQTSNLIATGTDGPGVLCQAEFSSTTRVICAGDSITYTDDSYHNVSQWSWSFSGGQPAVSQNPSTTVAYPVPGLYAVSLQVSDGNTVASTTANDYVLVLPAPGADAPLVEGFETTSPLPNNDWFVMNPTNNGTWNTTNAASYSGSKSVRFENYWSDAGDIDELISSTYDLSQDSNVTIGFRVAYAQRSNGNNDKLQFYASNDCGNTWNLRKQLNGISTLNPNGSMSSGYYTPTSPAEWQYVEITNITAAYQRANFRFKFVVESDGGNNIYIDDININGITVGLDEFSASGTISATVFPNPARDAAQLRFDLVNSGATRISMMDMLGRELAVVQQGSLAKGTHRIDLPIGNLQKGMYLVRIQQGDRDQVVRFVVD